MTILEGVAVVGLVLIAWSLYKAHKDKNGLSNFSLFDLLLEGGRVSKISFICMGAFSLHSWLIVQLTMNGKISEGYVATYGAVWVAPLLARMFSKSDASSSSTTYTVETKESGK